MVDVKWETIAILLAVIFMKFFVILCYYRFRRTLHASNHPELREGHTLPIMPMPVPRPRRTEDLPPQFETVMGQQNNQNSEVDGSLDNHDTNIKCLAPIEEEPPPSYDDVFGKPNLKESSSSTEIIHSPPPS